MPDTPLTWPVLERALVAALKTVATTYTEAPTDLAAHVPFVIVQQTTGGGQSGEDDLNPRADVDIVAATRREVNDLIPTVTQVLADLSCSGSAGVYFDDVQVIQDFGFIPFPDLDLRRANALIQFTVRPQP